MMGFASLYPAYNHNFIPNELQIMKSYDLILLDSKRYKL